MRFGLFAAYWEEKWGGDFIEFVKRAKRLGFTALEIPAVPLLEMSDDDLKALKDLTKDLDIVLSANYGPPKELDVSSKDPIVRDAGLSRYSDLMVAMDKCGCHTLIGALNSFWPYDFEDLDKQGVWDRGVESLKKMAKKAESLGISLCLEVLNRFETLVLNTSEEAVRFCEDVGSPAVKIHLDTFHMNIEEDSIVQAIRHAGDKLGHLHVSEGNRKLPRAGEGALNWQAIGQALKDINYQELVIMEPFVKTGCEVGDALFIWRDLSDGANDEKLDQDAKQAMEYVKSVFV